MNSSDPPDPKVLPWHTLLDEEIADCRIFSVRRVKRSSPTGAAEGSFYYVSSADWVNVVALSADGRRVLLIRQYRHGTDEITLEIPGGIIDEGESAIDAAKRELLEETGFTAEKLEVIGRVRSNPAIISNWTWTVLATGLGTAAATMFDEHEEIAVELIDVHEIDEKLRNGEITHALVVGAFMWYRLHQQRQGTSGDI